MKTLRHVLSTLAIAACFGTVAAQAQDVRAISNREAEDMVNPPSASEGCPPAAVLPNGKCAIPEEGNRGFSLAQPGVKGGARTQPAPGRPAATRYTQQGRNSGVRNSAPGRMATGVAAPRAREVPLQFALGSFDLSPQSRRNLDKIAGVLNRSDNQSKKIRITGHTDKSGDPDTNRRLSQARADAVATYLSGQGVNRSRLDAQGRAFDEVLPGLSAFDARNRRVEVEPIS